MVAISLDEPSTNVKREPDHEQKAETNLHNSDTDVQDTTAMELEHLT